MATNPKPNPKEVIYIDVDDEITAIIDKVRSSSGRIVALVLPKRATVLQSIVNMKLLKRTAESAKKHVVLITSEAGLLPLAGTVGMHVAGSLQTKPAIPAVGAPVVPVSTATDDDFDVDEAANRPIGELAGVGAATAGAAALGRPGVAGLGGTETIELDNETETKPASSALAGAAAGVAAGKVKKDSKLKIPDFNKFRLGLILGGSLLVGLLVFFYFAAFVLPSATVNIETDSSEITTNAAVKIDPAAIALNADQKVLPAKIEQKQQTGSQQVTATGQKNKGEKAAGTVTLSIVDCKIPEATIPSGTGVSTGGQTFITQSTVTLESTERANRCVPSDGASNKSVEVIAQKAGASYNIAPSTFSVAGFSDITGKSSSAMEGGTDDIVKSVQQSDIDSAKQKINASDTASVKTDLRTKLESAKYMALTGSFNGGEPIVTTSANVGDESDTVTVTQATTYTMYGIKKSDLQKFILANVNKRIDPKKQQVLNDGTDKAAFEITTPASNGVLTASLSATSLAGPDINTATISAAIKGKKTNDVRTLIKSTPGVTDVTVKYSPFWVTKMPTKESKITVNIDKPDVTTNGNADN